MLHTTGVDLWPRVFNAPFPGPPVIDQEEDTWPRHGQSGFPGGIDVGAESWPILLRLLAVSSMWAYSCLGALFLSPRTKLRTNSESRQEESKEKKEGKERLRDQRSVPVGIILLFAPLDSVMPEPTTSENFSVNWLLFCYFCYFQYEWDFPPHLVSKESIEKSLKEMNLWQTKWKYITQSTQKS